MSNESLVSHYQSNWLAYDIRMFLIGLFSAVQPAVVLAYLRTVIMLNHKDKDWTIMIELPLILSTVTPLLGRIFNSIYLIRIAPAPSLKLIGLVQIVAWSIFIGDYYYEPSKESTEIVSLSCVL